MDTENELHNLRKLLKELILPFHGIERDLDITVSGKTRNETDSEHTFTLALIATVLVPRVSPALDAGKVTQLSLVHDLVEIYADDTSVWAAESKLASKEAREEEAFATIAEEFSEPFPNLIELIEEYETKQTEEAVFVWALDKFVNFLTAEPLGEVSYKKRDINYETFLRIYEKHRAKGRAHPDVAPLYDELMKVFIDNKHWYAD